MTTEEVTAIFSLLDINKDGKLNYAEVSFYKHQVTSILTDPVATLLYIYTKLVRLYVSKSVKSVF